MTSVPEICFDKVLPQELYRPLPYTDETERTAAGALPSAALVVFRKLWLNGSTLRARFLEGTTQQRRLAIEQANWWIRHANLRFIESTDLDAEIRITFDATDGAWSYIGTDCRSIPQDQPTMNLGFQTGGTSAHEFGHAIGAAHEHQNSQGGIQWNEAEVIRDLSGSPNFWTVEQIRHNVFEKYDRDQIRSTQFDPRSLMLYAFPASWTLNGIGTHANEVLSETDGSFMAQMYPTTAQPPTTTADELVIGADPLNAKIGAPGEEDVYRLKVSREGRNIIETGGQTDVVMKVFGPNSATGLVGEDDDSGEGLNARIAVNLIPGDYVVQVRHYNSSRGTGQYTISARE